MQRAALAYRQTQVTTATPGHIVVMLFESAITALQQAKTKMREKDYATKGILISQALDIIAELDGSLNKEKGGELAQNLHSLYTYCTWQLVNANIQMNPALLDEVAGILETLRSAFAEIVKEPK
ncbi:MAG: flagellar export chaperone FliS [Desulfomicrobiaceae bacterium]|jgi:flagellar protein FliS|nr:flagellar export chaperone FliS [Desulfomicrobiaceae bacterium]